MLTPLLKRVPTTVAVLDVLLYVSHVGFQELGHRCSPVITVLFTVRFEIEESETWNPYLVTVEDVRDRSLKLFYANVKNLSIWFVALISTPLSVILSVRI